MTPGDAMRRGSEVRLTEAQWAKLEPLLPKWKPLKQGGRPWADNRAVFEGILWVLKTGARWRDLPEEYPSPATCWRRLNRWEEEGVWEEVWHEYLRQLDAKACLGWEECFIDATFMPAKRGVSRSGRLAKGRAQSAWWWQSVRVYRSVSSSHLRTLANRLSPSQRSQLYAFQGQEDGAGLVNFLNDLWRTEPTILDRSARASRAVVSTSSPPT